MSILRYAFGLTEQAIEIQDYTQTLSNEMQLPGTVSDYSGDAARAQFTAGVASALSVDESAITSLTFTASRRLRRLVSHAVSDRGSSAQLQRHRRRLQADAAASSSVYASYDVVTSDPLVANNLVAVTADPTAFTEILVTELNSAGTALPTLDTFQVSVTPPTTT